MKNATGLLAVLALSLLSLGFVSDANATTTAKGKPKLVGNYIFQFYETCMSTLTTSGGGSKGLTSIDATDSGTLLSITGVALFGPFNGTYLANNQTSVKVDSGKMVLTGTEDVGDLILINPSTPTSGGQMTEIAVTPSAPTSGTQTFAPQFSFTASSKKLKLVLLKNAINGNTKRIQYNMNAVYGVQATDQLTAADNNIAGRVEFVGKAQGCSVYGKAVLISTPGN